MPDAVLVPPPPLAADARTRPAARSAFPWVRGPAWDAVWMLSALWLVPLVLLLSRGDDPRAGSLDLVYGWLTALLWLGHRIGSTWLAYCTTAYQPLRRAEPARFVLIPAAIAVACFAILLPTDGVLAWSRAERVMALAILDYALVTHHFAAQHFGALRLYRARAGGADGPLRRLDRIYAFAIGGACVVVAEIVAGTIRYVDVWIDPWLDPDRVAAAATAIAGIASIVVVASTLAMLLVEARTERPSLPRALYLVGIGAMVVAAFHVRVPFVFVALWTTQHWIVATGLTALVAEGDPPAPTRSRSRAALHAVNRRPWAVLVLLLALSVLLLPVMEVEAVADGGPYYGERIFGAFAVALRESAWAPVLVALGFTTGFQHYWLDRAVYRFSDRRVRAAARGLLGPARA